MTTCLIWLHRNCFLDDNTLKSSLNIHRIFDKIEWHVIPAPASTELIVSLCKDGCHTSQVIFVPPRARNGCTKHPCSQILISRQADTNGRKGNQMYKAPLCIGCQSEEKPLSQRYNKWVEELQFPYSDRKLEKQQRKIFWVTFTY